MCLVCCPLPITYAVLSSRGSSLDVSQVIRQCLCLLQVAHNNRFSFIFFLLDHLGFFTLVPWDQFPLFSVLKLWTISLDTRLCVYLSE